jgi:hypothetical protein
LKKCLLVSLSLFLSHQQLCAVKAKNRTMMESLSFLIKKESLSSSVFSALNQGQAAARVPF